MKHHFHRITSHHIKGIWCWDGIHDVTDHVAEVECNQFGTMQFIYSTLLYCVLLYRKGIILLSQHYSVYGVMLHLPENKLSTQAIWNSATLESCFSLLYYLFIKVDSGYLSCIMGIIQRCSILLLKSFQLWSLRSLSVALTNSIIISLCFLFFFLLKIFLR